MISGPLSKWTCVAPVVVSNVSKSVRSWHGVLEPGVRVTVSCARIAARPLWPACPYGRVAVADCPAPRVKGTAVPIDVPAALVNDNEPTQDAAVPELEAGAVFTTNTRAVSVAERPVNPRSRVELAVVLVVCANAPNTATAASSTRALILFIRSPRSPGFPASVQPVTFAYGACVNAVTCGAISLHS